MPTTEHRYSPRREPHRPGGYNKPDRYQGNNRGDSRGSDRGERPDPPEKVDQTQLKIPIEIPFSMFWLPEQELTLGFQRAIGMAQGKIVDVNRKGKGVIEVEGHQYQFEDNRSALFQKKYPLMAFKDKEIKFNFWPTYSQKAAKFRKIDDPPKLKISNLKKEIKQANYVEIIGQVLMTDKNLFVVSLFSQTQLKKYFVTIVGKYPGKQGDFIQMSGELKEGTIHYVNHNLLWPKPKP